MSCYYGYLCQTCDVESTHWFREIDKPRAIYSLWPEIKALLDKADLLSPRGELVEVNVCIDSGAIGSNHELLEFLYDHSGHHVLIADQYGIYHPMEPAE